MYHGIIIDQQFTDPNFPQEFKTFAKKLDGNWVIYGIEVDTAKIEEVIAKIQRYTKEGAWYAHFYNDQELIVVFKDTVFRVIPHKASWGPIIEYGRALAIPPDQLTFWPNRFQDEIHYFV